MSEIDSNRSSPDHEEADTKIVCNIDNQANFVISCSDTVIQGNMHHLENENSYVWTVAGPGNKLRYVDISMIYDHL